MNELADDPEAADRLREMVAIVKESWATVPGKNLPKAEKHAEQSSDFANHFLGDDDDDEDDEMSTDSHGMPKFGFIKCKATSVPDVHALAHAVPAGHTSKKPAAKEVKKKPAAKRLPPPAEVRAQMLKGSKASRAKLYTKWGCSKCVWKPGCTQSCWKSRNMDMPI